MHFERAIKAWPYFTDAYLALGNALVERGDVEKAIELYREAVSINPQFTGALHQLGAALTTRGRAHEALPYLQRAIELNPDVPETHYHLGIALQASGKPNQAIAAWQRVLDLDPTTTNTYFLLGTALKQVGRTREAVECLREVVSRNPSRTEALQALAWILATNSDVDLRDPAEAIVHADRAAELTERRDAIVLDTLAASYAAAGQFERAVTVAQEAIVLLANASSDDSVDQIRRRLNLYRQERPYFEGVDTLNGGN